MMLGYGIIALIVLTCLALLALAVCGVLYLREHLFAPPQGSPAGADQVGANPGPEPLSPGEAGSVPVPVSPQTPETDEPDYEPYEFGTPLEASEAVEDTWFDTAVYLGDSRTEGLQLYSGLTHGDFYWNRGMMVFQADDPDYKLFNVEGEDVTLLGTLSKKEYSAVYIMLGINELGCDPASYEEALGEFVGKVIAAQPGAVVYLETMPPINDAIARKYGMFSYETSANVERFNEAIVRVAAQRRVVLLDVASVYRDEDGQLIPELASDGVHFNSFGYPRWADYLRTHTIDPERYFYSREISGGEEQ